jgi:hypothetical protein
MTTTEPMLTLPAASIAAGVALDRVRKKARAGAFDGILVKIGPLRCVRAADIEALKAIVSPPATTPAAAGSRQ